MIRENAHKYSISALCRCLGIARSTYYYEAQGRKDDTQAEANVRRTYEENRCVYGSRKIKQALQREGHCYSRRRIGRIMKQLGLMSAYARRKYRHPRQKYNEATIPNVLNRQFNDQPPRAVVVSDLTYVRVGGSWHYVCILLDLHNREIIGYSSGAHKDAELVRAAFASVHLNLFRIQLFHTDRGSEFDNMLIDELLSAFRINRSLSLRACPFDNAVAEATFKLIKTEFVQRRVFSSPEHLALELADYVHWFNHIRLHSTLGYLSPVQFRNHTASLLSD